MANKRLIGDDGALVSLDFLNGTTTQVTGDTEVIAEGKWVQIVSKASASSAFGGLLVGEFYYAPAEVTPHFVAGGDTDAWKVATVSNLVDLSGWSLELSGDEVEVTVMQDTYKKYRKGKLDAKGTSSFVFIKGVTDQALGLANYFFKEASISAAGAVTAVNARLDTPLYLIGYMDDTATAGETMLATVFQVEFFNFSLPENSSQAVKMDVPFRLVGDTDPILYRIVNA